MTEGRKDDGGKLRWSLFPAGTLKEILEVLEIGAKKYDVDNWKKVQDARRRYYDALMRHVESWWSGEVNDPEDGKHHLAHAGCCLLFLLALDKGKVVGSTDVSAGFLDEGYGPWHVLYLTDVLYPKAFVQLRDVNGLVLRQGFVEDINFSEATHYRIRKDKA